MQSCAPHRAWSSAQVDLGEASIRPGQPLAWHAALKRRLLAEVAASGADITIHVGNWMHDLRQVTGSRFNT